MDESPIDERRAPSSAALASETLGASSDVPFPQPFPSFQHRAHALDPAARNPRKLVIDSGVALPSSQSPSPSQSQRQSQIRRKPVSSTASPVVSRYSSGEYLAAARGLVLAEQQRASRSFSLDSPTVYSHPSQAAARRLLAPAPLVTSLRPQPADDDAE